MEEDSDENNECNSNELFEKDKVNGNKKNISNLKINNEVLEHSKEHYDK